MRPCLPRMVPCAGIHGQVPDLSTRAPPRLGAALPLEPGLLGEPLFEHPSREPDVSADSHARHPTRPHRLIDPTRLDRQQVRGLVGTKQRALGEGCAGGCGGCSTHPRHRPQWGWSGQPVFRTLTAAASGYGAFAPRARPSREIAREIVSPSGPGVMLQTVRFAGFLRCRRRDSNPRHADYDRHAGPRERLSRAKSSPASSGKPGSFLTSRGPSSGPRPRGIGRV
jgi:hypothetical protein